MSVSERSIFQKFALAILCLGFLSACASKDDGPPAEAPRNTPQIVYPQGYSSQMTALSWTYTSGPIHPDGAYSVSYFVDFLLSRLVITSTQGPLVAPGFLPDSETKPLNSIQLNEIRDLLAQISAQTCASGSMSTGGGVNRLSISINGSSKSALDIYLSDCTGFTDPVASQASVTSGYSDLTDYLESL